jgi:streptogramin lyase
VTLRNFAGTALCVLAITLSACSGNGSSGAAPVPHASPTPTPLNPTPTPTATPASSATPVASNALFVIVVPAPASLQARSLRPHAFDVSASAQSVKVALGSQTVAIGSISPASKQCTKVANGTGRSCTIGANVPAGNDVFTITAYDQPNGSGNVLASGVVGATISTSASTPATIDVSLDGTIAKLQLTIANAYPPVGTAATTAVVVTGLDADGNAVLGSFASPITLHDADASGATALSTTTLTSSSETATLHYAGTVPFTSTTITASQSGLASVSATFAPTPAFLQTYPAPGLPPPYISGAGVADMALGPDGNMWVVGQSFAEIIKVSPTGTYTQYPLPQSDSYPQGLAVGSDGDLWFAENQNNAIGKISPSNGAITEYAVPLGAAGVALPDCVTLGKDGKIWFVDQLNDVVGSITTGGTIHEFPLPAAASVAGITSGPDGNLWLADQGTNSIIKVSTSGAVLASYAIPSAYANVYYLTPGPDGNVWFTEFGTGKIGRVTPAGTMAEFPTETGSSGPFGITAGPDGRIWFAEIGAEVGIGKIGYITTDGSQTRDFIGDEYHVHSLEFDRTGKLWFTALVPFGLQETGTFGY